MRYLKYLLLVVVIIVLNNGVAYAAPLLEDGEKIPEYVWYFDLDDKLKFNGKLGFGGSTEHVYEVLLNNKRTQVMEQLRSSFKTGLKDKSVVDDSLLERDLFDRDINGRNLWLDGFDNFVSFDSYIISMRVGANDFNVYVPKGKKEVWNEEKEEYEIKLINEAYVNKAKAGFVWYQVAVKEAIIAIGVEKGLSVYTGFSEDKQLFIGTGSTGIMVRDSSSGGYIFGGVGSGDISYTLDYFYSPLFGKIEGVDVPKDQGCWIGKLNDILFDYNIIDKELYVIFDEDYLKFADEKSEVRRSIRGIADKMALRKDFTVSFKIMNTTTTPSDLVDYNMRVIVPEKFVLAPNEKYGVSQDGFSLIKGVRISLFDSKMYKEKETGYIDLGATVDFNDITGENLTLYHYKIGDKYVGALIPLKYREAIVDHTESPASVYLTGRDVIFNNDYNGSLRFDATNLGMMDIEESLSGKKGALVRDFAFEYGSDAFNAVDHKKLNSDVVEKFVFDCDFVLEDSEKISKGFLIYRNNVYLDDTSLIQWLDTDTAAAIPGVKAQELSDRITGVFEMAKKELSYDEWVRMQDIRMDLDRDNQNVLVGYIKVIALVFAVFLIVYCLLLILFYFIDIFNPFIDISLLNIATFGRMYPVVSGQEVTYTRSIKGDLKYVTFIDVFKFSMLGCYIGCLFLNYSSILKAFYRIYMFLTNLLGGI